MRIDDEDLRADFEESSDENLRVLEAGIVDLEAHPDNGEGLDAMLGAISRLHENALALEIKNLVPLTRQIEYVFKTIATGQQRFSADLRDRLCQSFDAIRKLVAEAVTGEPSGVNSFYVLANLMGATGAQERVQSAEAESQEEGEDPNWETIVPRQRFQDRKTAYIDDEELRYTFKVACEEHLQKLDNGLLHLEKHPSDRSRMEELLREIHSIKGDAGMLGVEDIVPLAHEWEQQLIPANEGKITLSRELTDRLYRGVDAIRQLAREAVTGERAKIDIAAELTRLTREEPQADPESAPSPETTVETAKELVVSQPSPIAAFDPSEPLSSPPESSYRIDTIRVETRYLDQLMTQAGELIVAQTRMAHRLAQLQEMIGIWEEWSRTAATQSFTDLGSQEATRFPQCTLTRQRGTQSGLTRSRDWEQVRTQVDRLKSAAAEDVFRLGAIAGHLEEGIRTLRLLPLSTIFNLYPRMVRDLSQKLGKKVDFVVTGGETRVDKRILEDLKDPLMHILQNAVDHGIESPYERESQGKPSTARLGLRGYQTATNVVIEVMDDGRGIDLEKVKQKAIDRGLYRPEELAAMTADRIRDLIFQPGFSTRSFVTAVSGRGVGMDVVRANVERLKGTIQLQSQPGQGCIFRLRFGIALATASVLLLAVDGITYALPLDCIETMLRIDGDCLFSLEGQSHMLWKERPIRVVSLGDLLEVSDRFRSPHSAVGKQPCVVIRMGKDRLGLLVDELLDRQDVVLKPQSQLLKRVRNVSGATILGTGDVCAVLAPQDLIDSVRARPCPIGHKRSLDLEPSKQTILLIEDSIATRTQEKRILESAGYEVVTAVDGLDGFERLKTRHFDAVVSDIQMPNLDGLQLTARIRQYPQYNELPIILVTSLATDADRKKGAEVGANAYITKNSFDPDILLETLRRLI
ncbi:MAG: hybrid sensor histidine kinase/response regulator [Cyanobacteria bacterium J055]|nr:MAG: hybrid sensor histidine kinase/response regulator [Cyanobacteria bacterium J055]